MSRMHFAQRNVKKVEQPNLNVVFPNQRIVIWAEVIIILKVKDSISDAAEESNQSKLYSKFAFQTSFQELRDLVARTGGDVPKHHHTDLAKLKQTTMKPF